MTGLATYVPDETITGAEIAAQSGIPEDVVVEKMGVREKRVCPPDDDHVTDMCVTAGERALADADLDASALDLVLFHGSEYKDHVVWSAAADVCERLGAENAYAHESYTLCAGAPIAMRHTAAQLRIGDVDRALLVTASREEDLVDYENEDSSFMFNFGSGGAAVVLEADGTTAPEDSDSPPVAERARATVRASAAETDGSFAHDVVMPAGGSVEPPSEETVREGRHTLDVPDPDGMKERLADVSAPAFCAVADDALAASGYDRADLDFVALTHMKRSFHDYLTDELGVGEGHHYLDEYGHVQSVDQALAVEAGLDEGTLSAGDVVLFLAAGTGYTWSATVLEWTG
ncbi:3-oxoacyl-ACP synthase [Halobaculum sp. MBLA0147]|uniref:3-oxoacyl-ACP synthase n=1 Tax=Halobaculum sp. MBLA0147 TaxID=3079934 RepID=UPI0035249DAB